MKGLLQGRAIESALIVHPMHGTTQKMLSKQWMAASTREVGLLQRESTAPKWYLSGLNCLPVAAVPQCSPGIPVWMGMQQTA